MSETERDALDRKRDAAVASIFGKFPELESANPDLLRLLLGYAWVKGYGAYASEKAEALEAELILRGPALGGATDDRDT